MTSRVAIKRQLVVDFQRVVTDQSNHAGKRQKIALPSSTTSTTTTTTAATATAPLSPPAPEKRESTTTTIGQSNGTADRLIGPYRVLGLVEENTNGTINKNNNANDSSSSVTVVYTALDTRSDRLVICRRLDRSKYEHLMRLCHRLRVGDEVNSIDEDANRVSYRRVIPEHSELVRDDEGDGHHYFVEPKSYGSLHAYVAERKRLSESECLWFFRQILTLIVFCHRRGVVLRDLKLRKFVFADPERRTIRLDGIDELFICPDRKVQDDEDDAEEQDDDDTIRDRHGCPAYVGPEILDLNQRSYSGRAADMWSLGVLVYVMLYGRYPFYDTTPARLFAKIRQAQIQFIDEANVSFEARSIIRCLLRRDPRERPTAMEISSHPWLQSEERWKYSSSASTPRRPCINGQQQQQRLVRTSSGLRMILTTPSDYDQCVPSIDLEKHEAMEKSTAAETKIVKHVAAQIRRTVAAANVVNAVPSR